MDKLLNTPIKSIINDHPAVATILNEYQIGCVSCNVGSCLLKDIVEIHQLPSADEQAMMQRVFADIYPGQEVELPKIARKRWTRQVLSYSPPIKQLVDEHLWIKRFLNLVPAILKSTEFSSPEGQQVVRDSVNFIRNFADKFHHAKEEDILFPCVDQTLDVNQVMLKDHETGRKHVKAMLNGLEHHNVEAVKEHLEAYRALLTEHIQREDEILYPWIDRNLNIRQVGDLFAQFTFAEAKLGREVALSAHDFVEKMELNYRKE